MDSDPPTNGNGESADKTEDVAHTTPSPVLPSTVPIDIMRTRSTECRQREHNEAQQTFNQAENIDEQDLRELPLTSGGVVRFRFQLRKHSYGGFSCDFGHSLVLQSRNTADAAYRFAQLELNE